MRIGYVGVAAAAVALTVGSVVPAAETARAQDDPEAARNVIFFIGDGMGEAQRRAGQLSSVGLTGTLIMDSLPVTGRVGTNAAGDEWITDSAAAATAYGTGVKTTNGAIGVDSSGATVTNLAELAKAAGKSVGVVTTSQVTDASAAAFAAHVPDRDDQSEIARQMIEEIELDVILGGGESRWLPEGTPGAFPDNPPEDPEEQSRSDQGDLIARAQELGYEYVSDAAGLDAASGPKLLGLFANEEMFQQFPEGQGDVYEPVVSLDQMTAKAIEVLSQNPNGFFLVVEEEAIDELGAANNSVLTIEGVLELDKAVGLGVEFAEANPDTLLLVTADHEVGGMVIEALDDPEELDESGSGGTVAAAAAATPMAGEAETYSGEDGPFPIAGSEQMFVIDWTTGGHTPGRVPLTAMGPGSERLVGNYENADVFGAIVAAMGLALPEGTPAAEATPGA